MIKSNGRFTDLILPCEIWMRVVKGSSSNALHNSDAHLVFDKTPTRDFSPINHMLQCFVSIICSLIVYGLTEGSEGLYASGLVVENESRDLNSVWRF